MTLVFVMTSPSPTITLLPPVTNKSFSFPSAGPRGSVGRRVTTPYWRANTTPAVDAALTFHVLKPSILEKVNPKLGDQRFTWTARSGTQSRHVGAGSPASTPA